MTLSNEERNFTCYSYQHYEGRFRVNEITFVIVHYNIYEQQSSTTAAMNHETTHGLDSPISISGCG